MNEAHTCELTVGEWWRPPERVGRELHRVKVRGKGCKCGRFEPSVRRPVPIRRERHGINTIPAAEILLTLSSEDNQTARQLLNEITQRGEGKHRWEAVARQLVSQRLSLPNLERLLDRFCEAGILVVVEANRGKIHADWRVSSVEIELNAVDSVYESIGILPDRVRRQALLELIEPALNLEIPKGVHQDTCLRIHRLIREQVGGLSSDESSALADQAGNAVATPSRWSFFSSILRGLAGLAEHLSKEETVAVESFSAHVYGSSKEFTTPRREAISQLVGLDLAELGIVERESELLVFGPIQCRLDSYTADGRATGSWLGLPGAVLKSRITIETRKLLVVENLTPFEMLARSYAKAQRWPFLGIFGGGYLRSTTSDLVTEAIRSGVKDVAIWADMDPDGILLTQDLIDLVHSLGTKPQVLAMDPVIFQTASRSYKVEQRRIRLLTEHMSRLASPLVGLAMAIARTGNGVEQEVVMQAGLDAVSCWSRDVETRSAVDAELPSRRKLG